MTNPIYNYYEDRAEVSIKIGDIEFNIKGYSADDALKVIKGLPLNSEEKSDDAYEELMPIFEYTMLRENCILEAKVDDAGGYSHWAVGDRGIVEGVGIEGVDVRKIRYSPLERPSTLLFTRGDIIDDFYLIRDGIRYRIVES